VFRAPGTLAGAADTRKRLAEVGFRPLELRGRECVKISFPPDRRRHVTALGRVLHNRSKELALERVNANVIVTDGRRIDQTTDDDSRAGDRTAARFVLPDELADRLPAERLDRRQQRVEPWSRLAGA
jgi:hypothetical protein